MAWSEPGGVLYVQYVNICHIRDANQSAAVIAALPKICTKSGIPPHSTAYGKSRLNLQQDWIYFSSRAGHMSPVPCCPHADRYTQYKGVCVEARSWWEASPSQSIFANFVYYFFHFDARDP